MKLALGTVQFGLDYGVANRHGKVYQDEVRAILDHAKLYGADTLDTAIAYGESEQRLGEIGMGRWHIITKLPAVPEENNDVAKWARSALQGSLQRLRVSSLKGLLLHRSQDLLSPRGNELYRALKELRAEGYVEKIGVSVYHPDELDVLLTQFPIDLVQVPFNVIDRRIVSSGWLKRLYRSGVEVHVRSIFLQGLLLMKPNERPEKFQRWRFLWDRWEQWLAEQQITALQGCLGFALAQPEISRVIVGVDSLKHLQEILSSTSCGYKIPPADLFSVDDDLINPSRWSSL